MEYIEVSIEITPFSDEHAEIVTAEISELGFESYLTEEPYLKAYIPREGTPSGSPPSSPWSSTAAAP